MISPSEVVAMKKRPSWPGLLASIESSIRQDRALAAYRFDPKRPSTLKLPTLLLTGSETAFAATQANNHRIAGFLTESELVRVRRSAAQRHWTLFRNSSPRRLGTSR